MRRVMADRARVRPAPGLLVWLVVALAWGCQTQRREETVAEPVSSAIWFEEVAHRAGIDLLYFTLPPYIKKPCAAFLLTVHDLKHVHRPQDHDAGDLARRRRWARTAGAASLVYSSYEH